MMNEIPIKKLQEVTGWSYPTALKFAQEHGTLREREHAKSVWYIPYAAVEAVVNKRVIEAQQMQLRMMALSP